MATVIEEKWTREDVLEALTRAARVELGVSFEDFVRLARAGRLDPFEHAEMLALLKSLPEDDPALVGIAA
ncbi:MAG TPA: hypothetical protein V6D08_04920 [Candidatus Obscuribacterales bacterium]